MIGRDEILAMIPHAGAMCLLDEVLAWDASSIHAASRRYADDGNPLRRADGTLGAATGIEIAAQAMAVHGRLTAPRAAAPVQGYLVSLREVALLQPRLDAAPGALDVRATRLSGDAQGATYSFTVGRDGEALLRGRATVVLEPAA